MIKKALAGVVLAVLAVFAVPAAAQAYVPTPPPGVTVGPGGTVTVNFTGFAPNEDVSFTLTGESAASATLASVVAAVETSPALIKQANAEGAVSVTVTLPKNASGSYTLTATGLSSGAVANAFITVTSGGGGTGATGGLPNTGAMDPALGLWAGGGLLALGAAFVVVLTVVRRQKASV
ncbi:LPXTG cell wall anchor domain-containing protein [Herbiconiux sp. CPCC 203407]|uniref:LPXTG cell wall anchor domain-containing protein n=1 Tax=Herbiconiux oxytropis TaxID=2970915 RepID=A0AA42BX18_9MICO|nr:LPXTG cell wall anchor domain-containing protein [Herbiconiux oxytropis]MCS5723258.1 LPXTG cell wall anchor domain-containing protein [Herbiconiux oxytropis]MCS5727913.1 LPXTG cell wall anchor domain-containing protein [Herbiconiux oxytropis]